MTDNLVLTTVEQPSRLALQEAIACFAEEAPEQTAEALAVSMLVIVGEACALLDQGKSQAETILSLKLSGLSEECSTPFVEKAVAIVDWNRRQENSDTRFSKLSLVAVVGMALLVAAIVFFATRA